MARHVSAQLQCNLEGDVLPSYMGGFLSHCKGPFFFHNGIWQRCFFLQILTWAWELGQTNKNRCSENSLGMKHWESHQWVVGWVGYSEWNSPGFFERILLFEGEIPVGSMGLIYLPAIKTNHVGKYAVHGSLSAISFTQIFTQKETVRGGMLQNQPVAPL